MTSRREFFGLLAAAPLVAPAVVKEMVATVNAPKYAGGFVIRNLELSEIDTRFDYVIGGNARRYKDLAEYPARLAEIRRMDGKPMRFAVEDIPNRLYGAQINAYGDAI